MALLGYFARMKGNINGCGVLKSEGKSTIGRQRHRWEESIKQDHKKLE